MHIYNKTCFNKKAKWKKNGATFDLSYKCLFNFTEKSELENRVVELQSKWSMATTETEDMKHQLSQQEHQILTLDKLYTENKQLQLKCATLETAQAGMVICKLRKQLCCI